MEEDLFAPLPGEGVMPHRPDKERTEKLGPEIMEGGSPILSRVQASRPKHLDGGRTILRPSLPYDDISNMMSCFLDLYIGARYTPGTSLPGCVCHATVLSGTVSLTAEGRTFQLLERDAIRFKADQPYHIENISSGTGRMLLEYQYLRGRP
ncbi:cupin domain-containing protein [uncultured Oscillibacter sp.]|uniref:cupin domain-containing protein n=1 Tax=uncultured Oscillibacter sp. TaxID=876091 RepID=UPI0025D584F1|nr:cupin domain-containing protein [uncultured Oscillibacter sp.]